jgi:hypothetical protein
MYERCPLYGCNIGAVSPWKGLRRRRPWLARYRWFLCGEILAGRGVHARILYGKHSISLRLSLSLSVTL